MSQPDDYHWFLINRYAPDGLPPRRTRWRRYAWCLQHPCRAWRTRGCGL